MLTSNADQILYDQIRSELGVGTVQDAIDKLSESSLEKKGYFATADNFDYNNAVEEGRYWIGPSATNAPNDNNTNKFLVVYEASRNGAVIQTCYELGTYLVMYVRMYKSGSWTEWENTALSRGYFSSGFDFDATIEEGHYMVGPSAINAPAGLIPSTIDGQTNTTGVWNKNGTLVVERVTRTGTMIQTLYYPQSSTGVLRVYMRFYRPGDTYSAAPWTDWQKVSFES